MNATRILEAVSALAVVATLIALIFEIRENTKAVEANTMHNIAEVSTMAYVETAASPELSEALEKWSSGKDLTATEAMQVYLVRRGYWRHGENQYFQYKAGTLNDSSWSGYHAALCDNSVHDDDWQQIKPLLSQEFVDYIEPCLRE